jgi:hypothetical protein
LKIANGYKNCALFETVKCCAANKKERERERERDREKEAFLLCYSYKSFSALLWLSFAHQKWRENTLETFGEKNKR